VPESVQITEFENRVLSKITGTEKKIVLKVYEKNAKTGNYELTDDARARDVERTRGIMNRIGYLVWRGYDGFIPYYHPLILSKTNEVREVVDNIDLYKKGMLFRSELMPREIYNDFEFVREFNRYYWTIFAYGETNVLTPALERRMRALKLEPEDLVLMREMRIVFDDIRRGNDLALDDDAFYAVIDVFKKLAVKQEQLDPILSQRDRKMLFTHNDVMKPEVGNTLKFIAFIEDFIFVYLDVNGRPTKKLDEFVSMFRATPQAPANKKTGAVATNGVAVQNDYQTEFGNLFTKSYYYQYFQGIYRFYVKSVNYRYQDVDFKDAEVQRLFSDMMGIYRLGTARIILDLQKLQLDQKNVANHATDIAIMIMLRILVATFIAVSFLISPIGELSKGADEVARGNLDIVLDIPTGDEIGVVAEKFNIMSRSLKKAFNEIKDKARMEEELRNAQEIQEAILPKAPPDYPGFSFSVYYKPQSEAGGDYYDFIEMDDTKFALVTADVTGHGVGAGMVMAMLRSALRTSTKKRMDAAAILKEVNPVLFRDTLPNMFATVFYGIIDRKRREMSYTVAGHTQGMIYNPSGEKVRLLLTGGMPVGMVDGSLFDPSMELFRTTFEDGDILVLYSDGITEAKSASFEEYGEARFVESIKKNANIDTDKMKDKLVADLEKFTKGAEQSDDISLILMRVK
jgi:serine phosphatase RsbU (regulator of sigma subunit)